MWLNVRKEDIRCKRVFMVRRNVYMRQPRRVLLFAIASAVLLSAQTDPPGRVGRLSYINGAVSFRPGDIEDWVPADINRPLTTGDHLWIDEGARAELHIGAAALRLNSRTAFEFLNLDDGSTQIRLTEGSLNIRVRSLDQNETFEVDTPSLVFSVLRPGEYRIDVNPDTETTRIIVRFGEGEVTGGGQAFTVHPREQAQVSGGDSLSYNVLYAPPPDEWDNWCNGRDRREDQSQSARYVSREMVGYQDLDEYGDWSTDPDYGAVWVPRRVVAGWAPYHYGHWVWVEPWGWTWVDDAPWGFAPFHYGRWAYVRGYWGWIPGPVAVRPVYAPALVAWVGGSRFSIGISVGGGPGIGWFALGPREVYVPSYRASPRYVNRVNVTNTTITNINVTNIYNTTNVRYVNREAPGAVMVVRQNAFGGRRVQDGAVQVRPEAIRSAEVINGAPIAPRRENVLGNSANGIAQHILTSRRDGRAIYYFRRANSFGPDLNRPILHASSTKRILTHHHYRARRFPVHVTYVGGVVDIRDVDVGDRCVGDVHAVHISWTCPITRNVNFTRP